MTYKKKATTATGSDSSKPEILGLHGDPINKQSDSVPAAKKSDSSVDMPVSNIGNKDNTSLSGVNDFLNDPNLPDEAIPEVLAWVISYYQTMSDAPKAFLFSSGLMTVAAVIGNKVYCQLGRQKVKPNLYMLLLAGSTVSRKSTAVSYTVHCLHELERRLKTSFLMPDSGSLEGMIEAMREPKNEKESKAVMNSGIACYSELAAFLDNMKKEYNKDFQSFIIDVYDGSPHRRSLKKEFSIINDPCLSIFGGITMAQFGRKITEEDKHSGFLQRFLIAPVPSKTGRTKSLVEIEPPSPEMEERLVKMLENIHAAGDAIKKTGKPFRLSEEAHAIYQASYDADQDFLDRLHMSDPILAGMLTGYHGRLDIVKIKIAMIFETINIAEAGVLESEINLEISAESMRHAIAAVGYYWRGVAYLIKENFKVNPYAQKLPKMMAILKKHKGSLTSRELQKSMGQLPEGYYLKVLEAGVESGVLMVNNEKSPANQTTKKVRLL